MPKPVQNLDLLSTVAGRVVLLGQERDVLQIDGDGYRALYVLEEDGNTDIRPLYAVAGRMVPSLSPEELGRLTAVQVGAVLAIARALVFSVEDQFPNSDGPTESASPAAQG